MRKRLLKKTMAVMLVFATVLSITGCNKGGNSNKKESQKHEETKNMVYEAQELELEEMDGDIESIFVQNDRLYVSTYEWIEGDSDSSVLKSEEMKDSEAEASDENEEENAESEDVDSVINEKKTEAADESDVDDTEENAESEEVAADEYVEDGVSVSRMYSMNLDGSDLKEITLPTMSDDEWINKTFVNDDGSYTYIFVSYDQKKEQSRYIVISADENGQEISREDITNSLNLSNDTYVSKIVMDNEDNLLFVLENGVVGIDKNMKQIFNLKGENNVWFEGSAKTKSGDLIVGCSNEKGASVQIVDTAGKKWGETYDLDIQFWGGDSLLDGKGEYDFFYKDNSGIYGYQIAEKKSVKLLDFLASNINSDNVYTMVALEDGRFLNSFWDEDGKSKIVAYSKVDPSTIQDKQTITIAMMWMDDEVKKSAMEFNKNNSQYQIQFKDYSNEEDPTTKMSADIIAGNVADIIVLDNLPVEQYTAKGLLEDLTPYIERDKDIKSEDMVDSLLEAMKIDGKLYYITPSFNIYTLAAASKDVGNQTGWTFEEFRKVLEEKGDGVRPFYSENKTDMLYNFSYAISTSFVDWTTGECRYDSQDFKDILELCNTGSNEETEYNEDSPSMPSLIMDGKVLFYESNADYESIQMMKNIYKGDITFIGYPNEQKKGSYFTTNSSLGIYSKSDVKDAAWEFIRTFVTKDYQCKQVSIGNTWMTPSRKDALDLKNKIASATEAFTDEYGGEHEPIDSGYGWDDFEMKIGPATQDEVNTYMNLINNTEIIGNWNDEIMNIVIEESKTYFSGDKSVDEVADIIQNRVKTYVNENR